MRWFSAVSRCSVVAGLALLALSCASRERKTVQITDHRAYLLSEAPEQFDMSALEGRRILIDPGHGGPRPGAVGPNGVREADVNLGVALHLWGLLQEAGADAQLTRTADTDVSDLPKPTLKQDLQARAAMATTIDPDVFISIHHNADIIPGSKKNDLETYYQLKQPGPSLDLAQAIHRHLARNTGERPNAILPGNFHVIRETGVPAILGEGSYVSSAENAEHIAFAAMQRLEAEAYFLGLVEYFSRGVPRIVSTFPEPGSHLESVSTIRVKFSDDRGVAIDPGTVAFAINGQPFTGTIQRKGSTYTAVLPQPLASGDHQIAISGRNIRGNSSRPLSIPFDVHAPVERLSIETAPSVVAQAGDGRSIVTARVEDVFGRPVRDGTQVQFEASSGRLHPETALVRNGVANSLWQGEDIGPATITASSGDVSASAFVELAEAGGTTSRVWRVSDAATGKAVPQAVVSVDGSLFTANADGHTALAGSPDKLRVSAAGYWPNTIDSNTLSTDEQQAKLTPVAGGVLHGVVIAIDPADGGASAGARGPTGLRAADINLRVARYLAEYLKSAGARPVLTREGDATTSVFERVEASEAAGAERFVTIRCGAEGGPGRVLDASGYASTVDYASSSMVEHYPTSSGGRKLSALVREALSEYAVGVSPELVQSVAYELTHTACPAIRVQALTPVHAEDELLLAEPLMQRRIAFALFLALAQDFGADPKQFGRISGRVVNEDGRPVSNASVYLEETWLAITDAEGQFVFAMIPAGTLSLGIEARGSVRQQASVSVQPGTAQELQIRLSFQSDR